MNTDFIKGVIVPLLTPIDENEIIDEKKLREMVDFVIDGGIHGILAFGSNGEFYSIEEEELERGFDIIMNQANKRVPVYFGIGAINTKKAIRLAKMGEKLGADGISVLQPMFLKPNEDELYNHFKAVADSIPNTPMLLYNNPGRTGYTLSARLVEDLARDIDNIVGMKDSSGDMTQTSEFIRRTRDIEFKVLGGKDTIIYGTLAHGGVGSVSTTGNMFPKLVSEIFNKYENGNIEESLELQFKLNPVRLSMDIASFPVATKDMANIMGLDVGKPYLPNTLSYDSQVQKMKEEIIKAGLI